jgi:superfamily II DNA or RNA helicase
MKTTKIFVDKICQIDPAFPHLKQLASAFKILDPNRFFEPAFKNGRWDGSYRFISSDGRFKLGLLREVCAWIRKIGYVPEFTVSPRFKINTGYNPKLSNAGAIRLDKEQLISLRRMNKSLIGVIVLPTGGGKTEIILDYTKSHPNLRILYLCTRKLLMFQTAKRAEAYLQESVNKLGGCVHDYDKSNRFTVVVDKTLANLLKANRIPVDAFDVVMLDECHRATADTLRYILDKLNWKRAFGFTGSYPTEKRNLKKHWMVKQTIGSPLFQATDKEYNEKHSERMPEIKIYRVLNQVQLGLVSGREIYNKLKYDIERNKLIAQTAKVMGVGTLIVVNHADHGKEIVAACKKIGLHSVKFISAKSGGQASAIQDLDNGDLQCLVSTPVIDEGISVNNIRHIVYAAGWKSEIQLLQRIGRGKRKKDTGKNRLVVVDFADVGHRVCAKNARQRFSVYSEVTNDITTVKPVDILKGRN